MLGHRTLCAVALITSAGLACSPAERGDSGAIETAGSLDAFAMRVGDCFDDRTLGADEVSDVPGVPCTTAHDNEVFAVFDVALDKWPGSDRVNEIGDEECLERFDAAIGAEYEESVLYITTLTPSQGSWDQMSDREVICIAYHMELEKLTGSVLGSGM
jgi:hypothetical protein